MPVYVVEHFDKAATREHMETVVREYPIEIMAADGVAELTVAADPKTAKEFQDAHPNWIMKQKID